MSSLANRRDTMSEILLDTQYAFEKFSLRWRIPNFSQVFSSVHADFAPRNKLTSWRIELNDKKHIYMQRLDGGEPVTVHYECKSKTRHKRYEYKQFNRISDRNKHEILNFTHLSMYNTKEQTLIPVEFENDIFELGLTMNITGPAITKVVNSDAFMVPNTKKLCDDFKKLLTNEEHSDLVLSSGTKTISVHKAILCARSAVFEKMFRTNMLENENNCILIDDIESDTLEEFVSFLYTGTVKEISRDKAMGLYYAADKYEVPDLQDTCSKYLEFHLTVDGACNILTLADQHRDENLKKAVSFFIQMHAAEVKLTGGWKDLVKTYPKLALEVLR